MFAEQLVGFRLFVFLRIDTPKQHIVFYIFRALHEHEHLGCFVFDLVITHEVGEKMEELENVQ